MKRAADLLALMQNIRPNAAVQPAGCQTCDGTGWQAFQQDGRRVVKRCEDCYDAKHGQAPGVPDDEAKTLLDTWGKKGGYHLTGDNEGPLQQALFFVQGIHPGLYICGDVGTGKTALACAVVNELHRQRMQVRFVRVSDLLKDVVQNDGDSAYRKLADVPVLCLDDIGAQKGSDYARQVLLQLYDARTDRGRRTVWTSNLSLDELAEFMGDPRMSSRIAGNAKVVRMDGEDYRLRKARQRR